MAFAQEKSRREWYVSYAWNDSDGAGPDREALVDDLCAAAKACGIAILRDKERLTAGDRISSYMNRLSRGDRVFIILSDKYLRSPYCMHELYSLWRYRRSDDGEFLQAVRVYTLPGTRDFDTFIRRGFED